MDSGQKILVVRVGALGDTLMATPLVAALAERDPRSRIDFLCSASVAGALQGHPQLRQVMPLRHRNWPIFLSSEKRRLIRELRSQRYDQAFLLESASRYRDLLRRCRVKQVRSFSDAPFDPQEHSSRNHLHVAGFEDWRERPLRPLFASSSEERAQARELLAGLPVPRVGFHCGYGPPGRKARPDRLKGWSLSNFSAVAQQMLERGVAVVLTGSPADLAATREIEANLPSRGVRNLAGLTSVGELGAVIENLDLFISVDSGPAHLAAVVGTPLIVLWGPAKLAQVRPLENGAPVRVVSEPVPCAPCYDTPAMKSCRANICMQRISPDKVSREGFRLLELELKGLS